MELGSGAVSGSLRERHRNATRHELRAAALKLFERDGFVQTSVDDIARAAGVSRSTFFRYFRSKEAVLAGDRTENIELFLSMLRERPRSESRLESLERTFIDFAHAVRSDDRREEMLLVDRIINSDASLRANRAAASSRWQQEVAEVLAERGGRKEPDLEDSVAAAVLGQIVELMGVEWRSMSEDYPVEELIRSHFSALRSLIR